MKDYPRLKTKEREAVLAHWTGVHKQYFAVQNFLQFAQEKGHRLLGELDEAETFCKHYLTDVRPLLDEFFEVDQTKLDDARRDVLDKHVIDTEKNRCTSRKSGSAPTPRGLPTTNDGKTNPGSIESSGATESKG